MVINSIVGSLSSSTMWVAAQLSSDKIRTQNNWVLHDKQIRQIHVQNVIFGNYETLNFKGKII